MFQTPDVTTKQIRIRVPANSLVHVEGRSTSPPALYLPAVEKHHHKEIMDTTISIPWFSDDRTQPNFINRLTDAVGTISYLDRVRAYWEADLAGRLEKLSFTDVASNDHSIVDRMFSLEIPSDAYARIDIRQFDVDSAPTVPGDQRYHVDLPYLPTNSSPAQIAAALGHLALLGFLISMWHTDLWMRMGYSSTSWRPSDSDAC